MVKAMKVGKESTAAVEKKKRKDKKTKILSLFILALIFMGFTIAGYVGLRPADLPQDQEPAPLYGLGTQDGQKMSKISSVTEYKALFGRITSPENTNTRLNGDLYALDQGLNILILTSATDSLIKTETSGEYIIYRIGKCDGFDCLLKNETVSGDWSNTTMSFSIYNLTTESKFLTTNKIGLPANRF